MKDEVFHLLSRDMDGSGWAGEVVKGPAGAATHIRPAQLWAQGTVIHNNTYVVKNILAKLTACIINVDQSSQYLRVRMSFTGFPDDQPEDGERLTSAASSSNKVKLSTNRRQKEKLMLAAANQKARSVIECSGDLEMLPTEARLSTTPAASSSTTSSPVKLKISGEVNF